MLVQDTVYRTERLLTYHKCYVSKPRQASLLPLGLFILASYNCLQRIWDTIARLQAYFHLIRTAHSTCALIVPSSFANVLQCANDRSNVDWEQ